MRRLWIALLVVLGGVVSASAQVVPSAWPGVTTPIFGNPSAVDGGGTFTGQLFGPTTVACVPAYAFTGATTTGIGGTTTPSVLICVNGSAVSTLTSLAAAFAVPTYIGSTASGVRLANSADGVGLVSNAAATDFGRLQFGGTTNAFPAIKRNGASIDLRLADDSGYANLAVGAASVVALSVFTNGSVGLTTAFAIRTAPTIASGGCTAPAVTWNNGTAAFRITIGTVCAGVKTFTLTMPPASNLWDCTGENITSDAAQASNYLVGRPTSTTAVVMTSYDRVSGLQEDFTASDQYIVKCSGG